MKSSRAELRHERGSLPVTLLLSLVLGGCAAGGAGTKSPWPADAVAMPYPPRAIVPGLIVHAATGRVLTRAELFDFAAEHRAIFVGEAHDNLAAHRVQAAIVKGIAERYPGKVVVGMEMFPTTAQQKLDAYNDGELSEEELTALWRDTWKMDPAYYQPLFDVIHDLKIPIVGLNLPNEVIRAISRGGVGALTPEQRELLPQMGPPDPYQRAILEAVFAGHGAGSGHMEKFMLVQQLWDESMAARAAQVLEDPRREDTRLIIIAGGYHVAYGVGIPRRLFRRTPRSYLTITTTVADPATIPAASRMDIDLPDLPVPEADVVWYVAFEDLREPDSHPPGAAP